MSTPKWSVDAGWLKFLDAGGFDNIDARADLLAREVVEPLAAAGELWPHAVAAVEAVRTSDLEHDPQHTELRRLLTSGTPAERKAAAPAYRAVLYLSHKARELSHPQKKKRRPRRDIERDAGVTLPDVPRWAGPGWVTRALTEQFTTGWIADMSEALPRYRPDHQRIRFDAETRALSVQTGYMDISWDAPMGTDGSGNHMTPGDTTPAPEHGRPDATPEVEALADYIAETDPVSAQLLRTRWEWGLSLKAAAANLGLTLDQAKHRWKKIQRIARKSHPFPGNTPGEE